MVDRKKNNANFGRVDHLPPKMGQNDSPWAIPYVTQKHVPLLSKQTVKNHFMQVPNTDDSKHKIPKSRFFQKR